MKSWLDLALTTGVVVRAISYGLPTDRVTAKEADA